MKFHLKKIFGPKIRKTFLYSFAAFGVFVLLLGFLLFLGLRSLFLQAPQPLLSDTVLTLHLGDYELQENKSQKESIQSFLHSSGPSLRELLVAIQKASEDDRIKAILLELEGDELSIAHIQELRDALKKFKLKRKPVWAFAQTFGELSNGTKSYYLATVADEIWLHPEGFLGFGGLMIEVPFAHDLLEKWKIKPRVMKREEYKSAFDSFTEKDFTPASKENMETLVSILMKQIIQAVSQDRKLTFKEVEALVHKAGHTDEEALKAKLVDRIGYKDELYRHIVHLWDYEKGKAKVLPLLADKTSSAPIDAEKPTVSSSYREAYFRSPQSYLKSFPKQKNENELKKFAIIYLEGSIVRGRKEEGEFMKENPVYDQVISEAIEQAVEDESVKAIILRVNSGGGSSIASEALWRSVKNAVAVKPVIISMSDLGASGAYLLSAPATKIVAQPGTLTGSIGVIGGKVVLSGLWGDFGVNWKDVHFGKNMPMWSTNHDFSPEHWKILQHFIEKVYLSFRARVAEGRKLDPLAVHKLAKGRVWTGEEAKTLGLVDELGGIDKAIELAKEETKIPHEEKVYLREFPKQKTLMERFVQKITGKSGAEIRLPSFVIQGMRRLVLDAKLVEESVNRPLLQMPPARVK